MAFIGEVLGTCLLSGFITWLAWKACKGKKHRIVIAIIVFLLGFNILAIFNGMWSDFINGFKNGANRATSTTETVQQTNETEQNPIYAKIGDLKINITYLDYKRVKSEKELDIYGYSKEEIKAIWEKISTNENANTKVWRDGDGNYLLSLSKSKQTVDGVYDNLDDIVSGIAADAKEKNMKFSGNHIDISGVHAYKIFEKDKGDKEWYLSETMFISDSYMYVIAIYPLFEELDLESETNRIIDNAEITTD